MKDSVSYNGGTFFEFCCPFSILVSRCSNWVFLSIALKFDRMNPVYFYLRGPYDQI